MIDFIPKTALKLQQADTGFKMTSDSVHLAQFMKIRKNDRVLDIGCSNGVLSLVASTLTHAQVFGIDIDSAAIELARSNAKLNGLTNVLFAASAVQTYQNDLFDTIVCNPPYFKKTATISDTQQRARFELDLTFKELAQHSTRLLKDKGRLVIIIPVERFHEWLIIAHDYKLIVKRCQFIHHDPNHQANTVLIEAVKNGKGTMRVEAPLFNR